MKQKPYYSQKYLEQFFESESSLQNKRRELRMSPWVASMLKGDSERARIFRNQLDQCLELAYRKGIVDNDLRARITNTDITAFDSAFYELKVAKLIESRGNEITFYPLGKNRSKLEYEAIGPQGSCLVEVKTLFESEAEKKEHETLIKLWETTSQVKSNFRLTLGDFTIGKDFSKKDFQQWLKAKLAEMSSSGHGGTIRYAGKSGFSVSINVTAIPGQLKGRVIPTGLFLGEISARNETDWPGFRVSRTIRHAAEQLPKIGKPCLIVVCSEGGYGLFDEELHALLYGEKYIDNEFPLLDEVGAVFSQKQNTRVSAVGFYSSTIHKGTIFEELEVYHNRYAENPIDISMFGSTTVTHFYVDSRYSQIRRL